MTRPLPLIALLAAGCASTGPSVTPTPDVVDAGPAQSKAPAFTYPESRAGDTVDDYFGTKVADPYRWMEDDNAEETKAWVKAQAAYTEQYLATLPGRAALNARLTELWNYPKWSPPKKEGKRYFFTHNTGLQPQAVLYVSDAPGGDGKPLFDPNPLAADGTVALAGWSVSSDGKLLAYALAEAGSDWTTWRVRDVATGKDSGDEVKWTKGGSAAWKKDGSGFFYSRFDEPAPGESLKGVNQNQKVYFHRLGTPQSADQLIYARPDQPEWYLYSGVTDDGRWLVISASQGTRSENALFLLDLKKPGAKVEPLVDTLDAEYEVVDNQGDEFFVLTDKDAPRRRLVSMRKGQTDPAKWKTIIPEGKDRDVLSRVEARGGKLVALWMRDAHHELELFDRKGAMLKAIELPTLGTINGLGGRATDTETFFAHASFISPPVIYRLDMKAMTLSTVRQPPVKFDPSQFVAEQVFFTSKDGTRVPMFLVHRKDMPRNGKNPTRLYGYGGFNISMLPSFSVTNAAWLEMGGLYAMVNLRGGGEYGKAWYDAGKLDNKQNVFDDFIAAAEHLIKDGWTSTANLAIEGGSNGGLLVGAVMTQRPDLFGAAVPRVGVMDMLRFHKFTLGWGWTSDYGSSDTKEGFDVLYRYSPLHNIKPGTEYPPTLVVTADHDDRVVPAHSFKFIAALQKAQAGDAPVMARIETRAGHGAGKPTAKAIEEAADILTFQAAHTGATVPAEWAPATSASGQR